MKIMWCIALYLVINNFQTIGSEFQNEDRNRLKNLMQVMETLKTLFDRNIAIINEASETSCQEQNQQRLKALEKVTEENIKRLNLLESPQEQNNSSQRVTIAQNSQTPYIVIRPSEIRQNLGQSVYVLCDPQVPKQELVKNVEWRNPQNEIIQSGEDLRISTSTTEASHQLVLMISNLMIVDRGNYTCSANYAGNQKLEKKIQILLLESIDFKDTETLQTQLLGSDAKIRCVVSADTAPTIDWMKDFIPLSKSDTHYIQQIDGILIKNIQESDEGMYRCRARVALLGEIRAKDIQVKVHIKPKITGPPKDTEGKEKDSVSFQCIATGKPAPKYQWVNKDSVVLNKKEGYYVNEVTGELRILDLRPDHAGNYRCTAENQAGETSSEATLRVLKKPMP